VEHKLETGQTAGTWPKRPWGSRVARLAAFEPEQLPGLTARIGKAGPSWSTREVLMADVFVGIDMSNADPAA
jgi:hypothetical protein